jgi:hypothetical protein
VRVRVSLGESKSLSDSENKSLADRKCNSLIDRQYVGRYVGMYMCR